MIKHTGIINLILCLEGNLPSTVPAGSLAKAASLGAKTVRGPLPERVSTSPHAVTAANVQQLCEVAKIS